MMVDDDLLIEMETDASLRAIAACLRRAQEDVESILNAAGTPLRKVDQVAGVLEELGDSLESCIDWAPRRRQAGDRGAGARRGGV